MCYGNESCEIHVMVTYLALGKELGYGNYFLKQRSVSMFQTSIIFQRVDMDLEIEELFKASV